MVETTSAERTLNTVAAWLLADRGDEIVRTGGQAAALRRRAFRDAALALDALRSLPVEQRMEAMGMEVTEYFCNIVWREARRA